MKSEFVYPKLMDRERTDTWEKEGIDGATFL
ncbi:MAG: hypothetical protein AAF392_03540 [Bacteroidota bacterium]